MLGGFASLTSSAPAGEDPAWQFFASFVAVFSIGAYAPARTALAALLFTLAFFGLGAWLDGNSATDLGYISFLFGGCWLIGRVLGPAPAGGR